MSPRTADPALRTALIEEAARTIAQEGSQALSLRRLTKAVGASTMAVYTHFGSMDELRRAIRAEGFARLGARMDAVDRTDDPIADLVALGRVYYTHATTDPNLYRAMFMEECVDRTEAVGYDTFERLVAAVARCVEAGAFRAADPAEVAQQLWAMEHGIVTLHLAGFLSDADARRCLETMGNNLLVAFAAG